jgi:hypothetical protein
MIEIVTLLGAVWLFLATIVARDLWLARRDRLRAARMNEIVAGFTLRPVQEMVLSFGDPYEIVQTHANGRSLYVWKSPPSRNLPPGRGLLTMVAEVGQEGEVEQIQWRDRVSTAAGER